MLTTPVDPMLPRRAAYTSARFNPHSQRPATRGFVLRPLCDPDRTTRVPLCPSHCPVQLAKKAFVRRRAHSGLRTNRHEGVDALGFPHDLERMLFTRYGVVELIL